MEKHISQRKNRKKNRILFAVRFSNALKQYKISEKIEMREIYMTYSCIKRVSIFIYI